MRYVKDFHEPPFIIKTDKFLQPAFTHDIISQLTVISIFFIGCIPLTKIRANKAVQKYKDMSDFMQKCGPANLTTRCLHVKEDRCISLGVKV